MLIRKLPLILPLLLLSFFIKGQTLTYDVILWGDKIGSMVVTRKADTTGVVEYQLRSNSVAQVMFYKRVSQQDYDVVYKNGKLSKVTAYNKVDDKTTQVKIVYDGTKYCVDKNKTCFTFLEPVTFSTLCLYFNEPQEKQRIFSEREAEFFSATKDENGAYTYSLGDGVKNSFYYTGGTVSKVVMKKSFITVELRLAR